MSNIPLVEGEDSNIFKIVIYNISISKEDWDTHETSWGFETNELIKMQDHCGGNVADLDMLDPEEQEELMAEGDIPIDAHLLSDCVKAYHHKWERLFHQLHENEEELNRIFIGIYGLQDARRTPQRSHHPAAGRNHNKRRIMISGYGTASETYTHEQVDKHIG